MKRVSMTDLPILDATGTSIPLFMPHVPRSAKEKVAKTLETRWIGQGPQVDQFEEVFKDMFCNEFATVAVGSGTDALHLAYLLAGLRPGDEVITPVFTCTATTIPLLYIGAKPVFADVDPYTLNIDVDHVEQLITEKTKAIVCVHYGGLPCDMSELLDIGKRFGIPVIEDAAHALGATYRGISVGAISDFTMFSFQAIKHITTGDGGLLSFRDLSLLEIAKQLRWFGIDRSKKQKGIWENDISLLGYKYQMTDIGASMGLGALEVFSETLHGRQSRLARYRQLLKDFSDVQLLTGEEKSDRTHAAWLMTVAVENRSDLINKLRTHDIESGVVHYRNDRYSLFSESRGSFPNMDSIEDKYLVLPIHLGMSVDDVDRVCAVIKSGW